MSAFIPEVWANRIFKHFREKTVLEDTFSPTIHLDPKDVWGPSGEDFSEAVAWARLLNIRVTKPHGRALAENFILSPSNGIPHMIPICSPTELIDALRLMASSNSNTFVHDAPAHTAQDKIRNGRITVRR